MSMSDVPVDFVELVTYVSEFSDMLFSFVATSYHLVWYILLYELDNVFNNEAV